MTATEFQRRLCQLAVREAMTFATIAALDGADGAVLHTTSLSRFAAGAA
jgi:hypothetical protein